MLLLVLLKFQQQQLFRIQSHQYNNNCKNNNNNLCYKRLLVINCYKLSISISTLLVVKNTYLVLIKYIAFYVDLNTPKDPISTPSYSLWLKKYGKTILFQLKISEFKLIKAEINHSVKKERKTCIDWLFLYSEQSSLCIILRLSSFK